MSAPARDGGAPGAHPAAAALPAYPVRDEPWPWWRVSEPVTTLTDVLLAALALALGAWLLAAAGSHAAAGLAVALAGAALVAVGLGAAAGGAVHGLVHQLGERGWRLLWRLTLLAAGLANSLLVAAVLVALLPAAWRPPLLALAALRFARFAVGAWRDYRFRRVVLDSAVALLVVAAAQLWAWIALHAPAAPWILGAVGLSVAGGALQQRGVGLHRHFNHNDLYHVVQGVALWLFYRGGLLLGVTG